jgi:hypothetical protein
MLDTEPTTDDAPVAPPRSTSKLEDLTRTVTIVAFALVGAGAAVGNVTRAEAVEPSYTYDIVLRTIRFGGSYYANGIHDKGPLDMLLYHAATWFSTHDGFWYVISILVAIAAALIATGAARMSSELGANRDVAIAVAAVVFVHFTLSNAAYAGVLDVWTITATLLALAWLAALSNRATSTPGRALAVAIGAGALIGLSIQTLLPTVFAAGFVTAVVLGLLWGRRPATEHDRLTGGFALAAIVAFISAPLWYALRGGWREFRSGWWTYGRDVSIGTGRSLGNQLGFGWSQLYRYYQVRPLAFFAVAAFIVMMVIDWSAAGRRERLLFVGLLGWFVGAWLGLVFTQRYSAHEFAITAVPTAFMIAALAGRAYRAYASRPGRVMRTYGLPLLALVLAVYLSGTAPFVEGMRQLSGFTSPHAHAVDVDKNQSGDVHAVRGLLDLVSREWDPLLEWTDDPNAYLRYHRIAATRFITKGELTGEIDAGRANNRFVLPETATWFASDVARSQPVAFVNSGGTEIPTGSPFAAYLANTFTPVYPTDTPIQFRKDVAAALLTPSTPNAWNAPSPAAAGSSWHPKTGTATYGNNSGSSTDLLPFASGACEVIGGTVASDGPAGGLAFHFHFANSSNSDVMIVFDGSQVSSGDANATYQSLPSGVTASGSTPTPFTLVIGRRAAALVVAGQIRAAVQLPQPPTVNVESKRAVLRLESLQTGPAPAVTGC